MIVAQTCSETQVLHEPSVLKKLANLDRAIDDALLDVSGSSATVRERVPEIPGRDVQILSPKDLPDKKGLSYKEGQARLLHDLASIELQAMELALRTLLEFPEAPSGFRRELAEICREEGKHLELCLQGLKALGLPWGSFPVHIALWSCVSAKDSLLDRILIVHRYLEGSGLDASHALLTRLAQLEAPEVRRAVEVIAREEIAHVDFGSRWYRRICQDLRIDSDLDFAERLRKLSGQIPKRLEKINVGLRRQSGFSENELLALTEMRNFQLR